MRTALLIALLVLPLSGQNAADDSSADVTVVYFVAPAYPRAARDVRIQGRALAWLRISSEGIVTAVEDLQAHPVFAKYVRDALKQWRFQPSDREHGLKVVCSFELAGQCEGSKQHPVTPETHVSAEPPGLVHIQTTYSCPDPDVD